MFNKLTSSIKLNIPDLSLPDFTMPVFAWPELSVPELTVADCQTITILGIFTLLLGLEASFSQGERRPGVYRQAYLANLGTFFLNDTLLSLLSVSSLWLVAERYAQWGLLSALPDSFWKVALSFLLLDLTLYFWHRANHAFDWLWMFHKVHHSDPTMNVTTAFRLHFVEVLLTMLVKAVFIVVVGVDAALVVANEALITLFVMFHHANLSFRGEHWLSRFTIVPYLHRVHHSARREEHDRNYGFVFSWWDRLFGTLAELKPAAMGLRNIEGQGMFELVRFGLTWQASPNPNPVAASGRNLLGLVKFGLPTRVSSRPNPSSIRAMIAEAAYFRAEKRGFKPGDEFVDWLEAEREITSRMFRRES